MFHLRPPPPRLPTWRFKSVDTTPWGQNPLILVLLSLNPASPKGGMVRRPHGAFTAKWMVAEPSTIHGLLYLGSVSIPGQLISENDQSCNQVKAPLKKKI